MKNVAKILAVSAILTSSNVVFAESSGSAVIPPHIVTSASNFDQDVQLFISNVSSSQSEIEISFFDQSGNIIHETASSPTSGHLYYSSGYISSSYVEPTSGSTVKFSISPNATVHLVWSAIHPSSSNNIGYGVIKWTKADGYEQFSLIARGSNNTHNNGVISEASFEINSGMVF